MVKKGQFWGVIRVVKKGAVSDGFSVVKKRQFWVVITAWKGKFQLKIYSFHRMSMSFGHFNAKT